MDYTEGLLVQEDKMSVVLGAELISGLFAGKESSLKGPKVLMPYTHCVLLVF